MKLHTLWAFGLMLAITFAFHQPAEAQQREKTSFQIAAPWRAEYDVRSDIAIIYGMNNSFEERAAEYKKRGYTIQFMTGIAWGEYQDYFTGKWDGKTHFEDGQVERNGNTIWHGRDVPYVVPSATYVNYIKTLVKRAIDAGVTAIYLEEPEFWSRGGYEESFKKEWQQYYGFPWMAQHESPEATYLSSKLKYQLYFNALKEVFAYAQSYSESKGARVKCYVPTHSLLNYSAWQIVSPEASLAALPGMDGYIAQVWTGTSREPVYFNGVRKERVFENAFLEYGSMLSMTAPTGRKMYFLTDPIEDRARSWEDYKVNYQATFTAQLMYPSVNNYEVMPWPNRIYQGKFKVAGKAEPQSISPAYATQMQVMVNALNDMPVSQYLVDGTQGIGVLVGNSMMFQRFPTHKSYEDPQLSGFYGMAMPLLKRGIPVQTVHMENLGFADALECIKVLVMSYSNMKPLSPDVHKHLAEWVKRGGVLIYYGRDNDPFQDVREWWNTNGKQYKAPSDHLFELMGIKTVEDNKVYSYGKGKLRIVRQDAKELVMQAGGDSAFVQYVKQGYEKDAKAGRFRVKNHLSLKRGPYRIIAVLDEGVSKTPYTLIGTMIDLFDPALPVLRKKVVQPGEQTFLYVIDKQKGYQPKVLCAASRVYDEKITGRSYSFITKSPSKTQNVMRIMLPMAPVHTTVTGPDQQPLAGVTSSWDAGSHTVLLQFENHCDGVSVNIQY